MTRTMCTIKLCCVPALFAVFLETNEHQISREVGPYWTLLNTTPQLYAECEPKGQGNTFSDLLISSSTAHVIQLYIVYTCSR